MSSDTHPNGRLLIGAHMATTGGIHNALLEGQKIGCTAVQVFTTSPQQWKARPISDDQARLVSDARSTTGIHPLVVHDSYLINLASADDELRGKSLRAFLEEMERCEALGVDYLVTHCGACGKETEDEGIARLAASLSEVHRTLPGCHTKVTLEVTAGQGTCLGHRFDHLAHVLERADEPERLRFCFDTCHAFAAGYDLRSPETYADTWEEFNRTLGLDRLAVLHLNDSKKGLGSRVDRHEHIGRGAIGPEAFRLIMRDDRFAGIPKIVETPDFKLHGQNIRTLLFLQEAGSPVAVEDLPELAAA